MSITNSIAMKMVSVHRKHASLTQQHELTRKILLTEHFQDNERSEAQDVSPDGGLYHPRIIILGKNVGMSPRIFTSACKVMFSIVCVCVCVCFEAINVETSFMVWWYILIICSSNFSIKVIWSRSHSGKILHRHQ